MAEKLSEETKERIKEQIIAIQRSAETNMFDSRMVQYIANREGYYELVVFIEEHRDAYAHFILTGEIKGV